MRRSYDVHGLCLSVEAEAERLSRSVEKLLGPFTAPCAGERPFSVDLAYGVPPSEELPPPGMRKFWDGVLPIGLRVRFYTCEDARELHVPGRARMRLDLASGRAHVVVKPGEEACLENACLILMLCEFLAQAGHYVLHAACLAAADAGRGRAVLIAGASGTGKTTTALALAGAGMALVTDDASFLTLPDAAAQPLVWGLPRGAKVHRRTLALLPWLEEFERRPAGSDEFAVSCQSLLPQDHRADYVPALVLLLESRNPRGHLVRELEGVEALARLTAENVRAFDLRASGPSGRAFGVLAALVRSTSVRTLSVGPRLDGLREVIEPLMGAQSG